MSILTSESNCDLFPSRLIIEVSRNCNLNCIMCGFGGQKIRSELFIPHSLFSRILYEIAFPVKEIRLSGRGESCLHPQLPQFISECEELGHINLSLFTNLSWDNQDLINAFYNANMLLFFSIDSPIPSEFELIRKNSSYNRFISNLNLLRDLHQTPYLVFTLQEANIGRIIDIANFAIGNQVGLIYNIVRSDDQNYKNHFESILTRLWGRIQLDFEDVYNLTREIDAPIIIPDQIWGRKLTRFTHQTSASQSTCPNIFSELFFGFDGTIFPCNMFNPYIYGNIRELPLSKVWFGPARQTFIESYRKHPYCQNCEFICEKV